MDINNFSYAPTMGEEKENEISSFENISCYGKITIEKWGNKKKYVVSIIYFIPEEDIVECFPFSPAGYELAVKLYNQYTNNPIPLF